MNNMPTLDEFIQVYNINHIIPDNFLEIIKDALPLFSVKAEKNKTDPRYCSEIYSITKSNLEPTIKKYMWSITNYVTQEYAKLFNVPYEDSKDYNPLKTMYNLEGLYFYVYENNDYCDFHVDQNIEHTRDISFIILLNDNYQGGIIEFYCGSHLLKKIPAKKNTIVVFPSNYLYTHRVTPVYNGKRYVLVFWIRIDN